MMLRHVAYTLALLLAVVAMVWLAVAMLVAILPVRAAERSRLIDRPISAPQPKEGQCPAGYAQSGGYCAPSEAARRAFPKGDGQCPSGYAQSGGYCLELAR